MHRAWPISGSWLWLISFFFKIYLFIMYTVFSVFSLQARRPLRTICFPYPIDNGSSSFSSTSPPTVDLTVTPGAHSLVDFSVGVHLVWKHQLRRNVSDADLSPASGASIPCSLSAPVPTCSSAYNLPAFNEGQSHFSDSVPEEGGT